jgi:hypothetical protein
MTQDDIIDMAQEAGFVEYELDDGTTNAFDIRYQRFANLVAAAEREACARLVEPNAEHRSDSLGYLGGAEGIDLLDGVAAAIRARGENT